jgi:hypothetical protein
VHPEEADRARADAAAGERRLADEHQRVERVPVAAHRSVDEAVVGRKHHRREERPVEPDLAGRGVELVLVPRPLGDLDGDRDGRGVLRVAARHARSLARANE